MRCRGRCGRRRTRPAGRAPRRPAARRGRAPAPRVARRTPRAPQHESSSRDRSPIVRADDSRVVLTDEAIGLLSEYLQVVERLLPLLRRYWLDALIVLAASMAAL